MAMCKSYWLVIGLIVVAVPATAAEPLVVKLWSGNAPGEPSGIGNETTEVGRPGEQPPTTRVSNVTEPTISLFLPAPVRSNGTCVLIAPGGAYNILAWDKEGTEVAAWLNGLGVTGAVLKYRVPRRPQDEKGTPPKAALQDAQRAISTLRHRAAEWNLDPKRIGMLGFSAGGHLTAWTSTQFDNRAYAAADDMDAVSCRPDFSVLVYPAYLEEGGTGQLSPKIPVTANTPPMFLAHAADDRVSPENSLFMFLALQRAKVPAELHIYSQGGHGFGLRPSENPSSTWPASCERWLRVRGLLIDAATN